MVLRTIVTVWVIGARAKAWARAGARAWAWAGARAWSDIDTRAGSGLVHFLTNGRA